MSTGTTLEAKLEEGRSALIEAAFLTGDYEQADLLLEAAQHEAETCGDRRALATALDQLGFLQHWKNLSGEQQDVDRELSLFEEALAIRREIGDDAGIAESLFHVGLVQQIFKRDWDAALPYFEQARDLAETAGDTLLLSETHRHIGGYLWVHEAKAEEAIPHLRKSVELREKLEFRGWLASGLITLGQCELAAGKSNEGVEHLREGIRMSEDVGMLEWWTRAARKALSEAK